LIDLTRNEGSTVVAIGLNPVTTLPFTWIADAVNATCPTNSPVAASSPTQTIGFPNGAFSEYR
jgi:hypothetical protein